MNDWALRRAEISALAQKYVYGEKPSAPESVTGSVGNGRITVTVKDKGKTISFDCTIQYPSKGKAPYPAMIGMGMNTLNTSVIRDMGVALITLPVDEIAQQSGMHTRGKGKFYDLYGSGHSAGALMAWAWGASRLIDALEVTPSANIDAAKIAVTGGPVMVKVHLLQELLMKELLLQYHRNLVVEEHQAGVLQKHRNLQGRMFRHYHILLQNSLGYLNPLISLSIKQTNCLWISI